MKALFLSSLAALASWSSAAAATCVTVEPVLTPAVRIDPLDAAGPAELAQPMMLTFRRTGVGSGPITVRFQVVDEDSQIVSRLGRSLGPRIMWQGEDSSRDIGALRSEPYTSLRAGRVVLDANDQTGQARVVMRLTDLREDLPAGVYREQFSVRYWCEDGQDELPYDAQGIVAVSAVVPNVLSANIAGVSARGEIDFLDFAVRARELQVSVRSTGPYRLTARSLNGGVLMREQTTGHGDQADRIPYRLRVDNLLVTVDGATAYAMPRAGLSGRQARVEVEVEDVHNNRAGAYADTLFLTLSPAN